MGSMSGSLFELNDAYKYGYNAYLDVKRDMLDGIPICCNRDAGLLAQMIAYGQGGDHLEIGSAYGGSAFIALRTMDSLGRDDKLVCIEPFGEERRDTLHKAVEKEFWRNVEHFGFADRIEHIKEFSHPFPIENGRRFATALIDGDHSYEYVLNDWLNVKEVVDKYIMFHDYTREAVRKVVIEHAAPDKSWVLVAVHGWSAVMKWTADGNNAR
jgi:cephalosporin hydroxylase